MRRNETLPYASRNTNRLSWGVLTMTMTFTQIRKMFWSRLPAGVAAVLITSCASLPGLDGQLSVQAITARCEIQHPTNGAKRSGLTAHVPTVQDVMEEVQCEIFDVMGPPQPEQQNEERSGRSILPRNSIQDILNNDRCNDGYVDRGHFRQRRSQSKPRLHHAFFYVVIQLYRSDRRTIFGHSAQAIYATIYA